MIQFYFVLSVFVLQATSVLGDALTVVSDVKLFCFIIVGLYFEYRHATKMLFLLLIFF